jgi:HPt (histidine-containing phosphotransfer) domain-containing protein
MPEAENTERFAEVYAALQKRFVERSYQQRVRLAELCEHLKGKSVTDVGLREIEQICHTLHGNAGTFGFTEVGILSGQTEHLVRGLMKARERLQELSDHQVSEIATALDRLCIALEQL